MSDFLSAGVRCAERCINPLCFLGVGGAELQAPTMVPLLTHCTTVFAQRKHTLRCDAATNPK